jgi:hypothetical protein
MALRNGFTLVTEIFTPAASKVHLQDLLTDLDLEDSRFPIWPHGPDAVTHRPSRANAGHLARK